jgi:pimeloyl-ACP methyl ester carboxylesterase
VQEALGWKRAHLLGVSMGAGVAQLTGMLHPERVRTLILISGIPPPDPAARQRQLAAIRATKTPEGGLARITAPTLVIHGEADPLVRPAASRALARAIPRARLVTYRGHGLPPGLWLAALDEISALVERQNTTSNPPAATPGNSGKADQR